MTVQVASQDGGTAAGDDEGSLRMQTIELPRTRVENEMVVPGHAMVIRAEGLKADVKAKR